MLRVHNFYRDLVYSRWKGFLQKKICRIPQKLSVNGSKSRWHYVPCRAVPSRAASPISMARATPRAVPGMPDGPPYPFARPNIYLYCTTSAMWYLEIMEHPCVEKYSVMQLHFSFFCRVKHGYLIQIYTWRIFFFFFLHWHISLMLLSFHGACGSFFLNFNMFHILVPCVACISY